MGKKIGQRTNPLGATTVEESLIWLSVVILRFQLNLNYSAIISFRVDHVAQRLGWR
jgi:hypothetical protein